MLGTNERELNKVSLKPESSLNIKLSCIEESQFTGLIKSADVEQ